MGAGRGEMGDATLEVPVLVLEGDAAHASSRGEFPFSGLCFLDSILVLNPLVIITEGRTWH